MKLWTKEERTILGISDKESQLLEVLKGVDALNTSALAYEAALPRVTAMRILATLKERGLVIRTELGKEVLWSFVGQSVFERKVTRIFSDSQIFNPRHIDLSEIGSLTIYHGNEEMLESNRKILLAHAGERVLAVEPNGLWKHFAQDTIEEWRELNLLFKKHKILIEVVMEEGFEKVFETYVHPDIQKSFLALAVDIRVVPARVLDSATEVLIFRDQILFMDWAHHVAVEIKNPSTTRVVKAMYRMLQKSGRVFRADPHSEVNT